MTPRDRFLGALSCRPVDRPPFWLMRQAGRYLPEYRALKETHDFLTLVRTPGLAAEVTLQPLRRFPLDAAVIFSDILVIPEALGQGYHFRDEGGIRMDYLLDTPEKLEALDPSNIRGKLAYVGDAIREVHSRIAPDTALIGFCGSPWTLASYMIEGESAKNFTALKRLAWGRPEAFESFLGMLADVLAEFLNLQIDAGADAVQIFDSCGALCPASLYEPWSLRWIRRIVEGVNGRAPVVLFAKGMGHHGEALAATGASCLSVDWTVDLAGLRQTLGPGTAIQGNLDPAVLTTDPETTRAEARRVLAEAGTAPGHIFNLGHGMLPWARIDCVEALAETVTRFPTENYG